MTTIEECRLYVLPLMEAINKTAAEWDNAPVGLLRALKHVQQDLKEMVDDAIESEFIQAWESEG